ncbi:methylglyoxal reductase (NADPH-dependent) gre2 [Tulasnella sp. 408]|nr:methylglyoxal reductase (NADPH-dependent) gre2 [Tulasnella sp. 408]
MPNVSPPAKVLVTGASGFIAAWICQTLLDKGYSVVGTVRSESKGDYLKDLFKDFGDKFSYVIVKDIDTAGAFDQAVVGVDAVQHTASPSTWFAKDPKDIIDPAVHGTVGILESIKKYAPTVKRVVLTSSIASVYHAKEGLTYDETDWNVDAPKAVEELGRDSPGPVMYSASKVLAERGAWDFMEKNKGSINFDLVSINPSFVSRALVSSVHTYDLSLINQFKVWGPPIQQVTTVKELNETLRFFHEHTSIQNPPKTKEELAIPGSSIDVRDVALAHVVALTNSEAAGERFIVSSLDIIHAHGDHPEVPKGFPGTGKDVPRVEYISTKAQKTLGIKFRTLEEVTIDTLAALRAKGF